MFKNSVKQIVQEIEKNVERKLLLEKNKNPIYSIKFTIINSNKK